MDNATKSKRILRALLDTGSSATIICSNVLPSSTLANIIPSTRSFKTMSGTMRSTGSTTISFAFMQFAPHRTITHEVEVITEHDNTLNHGTQMIIGRDLIKNLDLVLDYSTETPSINWEGVTVPITPKGYWNKTLVHESFSISLLEIAERNFEKHSPTMIAAGYSTTATQLDQFIPTHLLPTQQQVLLDTLYQHKRVFDNKLGTLPGAPISLQLRDPTVRPYHGRAFPVPQIHQKLIKD
jgi:hypothetical protein